MVRVIVPTEFQIPFLVEHATPARPDRMLAWSSRNTRKLIGLACTISGTASWALNQECPR